MYTNAARSGRERVMRFASLGGIVSKNTLPEESTYLRG
jgi:hypothetical protein